MSETITPYEFFFDGQQKRFLEQIVRAFSGFSYQTGMVNGQPPTTVLVPCTYATSNEQVASIIMGNSENMLPVIPHIVVYQTGLRGRREDLQNRTFIDNRQVFERNIIDGFYGPKKGNAYNVDRLMPLPFNMDIQVDVATSNLEQKHQLSEQILIAMYPDFEIQNSENALDWTAVSICFIDDDITWSSRTIPIGTNTDNVDVFSLKLRLPIYLTPPAKIKRISRIEEIVANVGDKTVDALGQPIIGQLYHTVVVTPGDHFILVNGNIITLLNAKAGEFLPNGSLPSWSNLFNLYGTLNPGSELRLLMTSDLNGPFVAGTITLGSKQNEIIWTVDADTQPANTLSPVDAYINPLTSFPGQNLPSPVDGARYLLAESMGISAAWGTVGGKINDIIQYSAFAGQWIVSFNSQINPAQQYVLNLNTGSQFRWTGSEWVMAIDTFYGPGYWRLAL
jgi:hypothetical protein